jgi:hypothetical protein
MNDDHPQATVRRDEQAGQIGALTLRRRFEMACYVGAGLAFSALASIASSDPATSGRGTRLARAAVFGLRSRL